MLQLKLDPKADAAYVTFSDSPVARTREQSDQIVVDYDEKNNVVGVEVLGISAGVDLDELHDLPEHDELVQLFVDRGIKTYA